MKKYTDDLIDDVLKYQSIPLGQNKFSRDDIRKFLIEELTTTITSDILSLQEEYFINASDVKLSANKSEYDIPEHCPGWKVRAIFLLSDDKNFLKKLSKTNIDNIMMKSPNSEVSTPDQYYFLENKIVMSPYLGSNPTGYLRILFPRRLRDLVEKGNCGLIETITDLGTQWQFGLSSVPTTTDGLDFVKGLADYKTYLEKLTSSDYSISGNNLTVDKDLFTSQTPVLGDWVTSYNTTPIPQIPDDFHPSVSQAASVRILESIGDNKNSVVAEGRLNKMRGINIRLSKSRDTSQGKKLVKQHSILRRLW